MTIHESVILDVGNTTLKKLFVSAAMAALMVSEPAIAGSVTDPVVEADVVAQAAVEDSMGDIDALMVALGYIFFLLIVAGAF